MKGFHFISFMLPLFIFCCCCRRCCCCCCRRRLFSFSYLLIVAHSLASSPAHLSVRPLVHALNTYFCHPYLVRDVTCSTITLSGPSPRPCLCPWLGLPAESFTRSHSSFPIAGLCLKQPEDLLWLSAWWLAKHNLCVGMCRCVFVCVCVWATVSLHTVE